ncbi:CYSTEINE-RICH RECEPTOR-LIKE PROTEIN KINASE 25 [Salix viminalis]|uniref:CYSTEINE-RICH RECEPTOR-LIKE PROTEIN KINASE 25 n=1 Tax=Salix viminalis TaxID=40686 RepID=A0A9Q0QHR2_SALVM|nr:CYSTEINE-RICH RECEPTOR-LIKE PROTEIN KINASE 25 [Salix viminalis]
MDYFLIWLSVSYSVILYSPLISAQQFAYHYHKCTDNSTYTANSSYPSNLNATLSSLYENAFRSDGFGSISVGKNSDRVFALFQCRGDDSPESCRGCIKTAREDIEIRCPNYKEAIIWYDRCMLRYSNRSIFSVTEESPKAWLGNPYDIGNPIDQNQFNSNLVGLMSQLISRAESSSNFFAMGYKNGTAYDRIFGTVQCTPDISPSECRMCLSGRVSDIGICCSGKLGGNVLTPSCSIRFETYPFYTAPPDPPPPASSPSPPTPPTTSLNPSGERKASSRTILYISVPTSAFVVLFFSICYYCYVHKKAKKENSAMKGGNGIENMERNLSSI